MEKIRKLFVLLYKINSENNILQYKRIELIEQKIQRKKRKLIIQ